MKEILCVLSVLALSSCQSPLITFAGGSLQGPEEKAESFTFAAEYKLLQLETRPDNPYSVWLRVVVINTNLYIDGGRTIQNFLKEDLVDEMIITTIPILLGGGIPLFGELNDALRFRHTKTEVLSDALVKSHFSRDR